MNKKYDYFFGIGHWLPKSKVDKQIRSIVFKNKPIYSN